MKITECMPKMRDDEYVMYAQNEENGLYVQRKGMKSMECMPKIRHGEYGIYAQNDG